MSLVGANTPKDDPVDGVYVVRLSGNVNATAVARLEGLGASTADIGNTFTIGAGSPLFGSYVSYTTHWMGDTAQDSELQWNGLTYRAGVGSGSAGYMHSGLPAMSEGSSGEKHTDTIVLRADAGAHIEFRFKVRKD